MFTNVSELYFECSFIISVTNDTNLTTTDCCVTRRYSTNIQKLKNRHLTLPYKIKKILLTKGGNYSNVLPFKAARRDIISNSTPFGFKSELHTNPMPFHLESLWGVTLMPHKGCAMDSDKKIVRVGKTSGPVLSHLWTKVYEVLGQRRRPFVLSKALARLYVTFRSADIRH